MSDKKPLVIPETDAVLLGMYEARFALASKTANEAGAAREVILKKHGLLNGPPTRIITDPGGPHPIGTVLDGNTGKPLMVTADGKPEEPPAPAKN